jgi:HEAT repeat protein
VKAARLLARLGDRSAEVKRVLREGLEDRRNDLLLLTTPPVRMLPVARDAARGIAELGPDGREAIPGLAAALETPDPVLRVLAAEGLWRADGRVLLDPLIDALETVADAPVAIPGMVAVGSLETTLETAREAARVIAALGPTAAAALPAIERAIADPASRPIRDDLRRARDAAARKTDG